MVERTFSFGGGGEPSTGGGISSIAEQLGAVSLGGTGDTSGDASGSSGGERDDTIYDPARHLNKQNGDGTWVRRQRAFSSRSRRGTSTGPRPTKAEDTASIDALTQMLMIVHAGLATVTKVRELKLDEDEGKTLATAVGNVMREFDIPIDRKTQAMVGLVVAGASIYGPRLYLYNERMKGQRKGPTEVPKVVTLHQTVNEAAAAIITGEDFPPQ